MYYSLWGIAETIEVKMMEWYHIGLAVTGIGVLYMVVDSLSKDSVGKVPQHTHAADGSINGIRGWY